MKSEEDTMVRKGLVCFGFTLLLAATAMACVAPTNDAVKGALAKDLAKYPGVVVSVDDCVATLNGQVDRFTDKQAAARKARNYGAITSVVNKINVGGPAVADNELATKLARKLAYDRTTQGNVFDWYTADSQNGAV